MRGWSGLQAAMDFAIECQLGKGKFDRKCTLEKVKDEESGRTFNFALQSVHLGYDEDDDEISSLVIIPPVSSFADQTIGQSLAERDADDDEFVWQWVKMEVEEGKFPSVNSLDGQRGAMQPQRSLTQKRVRDAVHRLMAKSRLAYASEKSPSGNKWIRAVQ
jgi:hypothetical protein